MKSKITYFIALFACGSKLAFAANNIPESCENFEKYDSFFSDSLDINSNFRQFINDEYRAGGMIKINDKEFVVDYNHGDINAKLSSSGMYMIYFDRSLNQKSYIPKSKIPIYSTLLSSRKKLSSMKILECRIADDEYEILFDKINNNDSLKLKFINHEDGIRLKEISQLSDASNYEIRIEFD